MRITLAALCTALLLVTGCTTLPGARPLEPGSHQIGLTLGGPSVLLGGAPVPLPNANIEAKHGVTELGGLPLDVHYSLNATALAFGILQMHAGSSYLVLDQDGAIPAISITDRIFFAFNPFNLSDKADGAFGAWGMNQLEIAISYLFADQLVYFSLSNYLDFGDPGLLLTPALGAAFDPGSPGGLRLNIELRYYALSFSKDLDTVQWWPGAPSGPGSLGIALGFSYELNGGHTP